MIDSQSVKTTESGGPRGGTVLGHGKAATPGMSAKGQEPAPAKAGGRKRHIVTGTTGLLVGAEVHAADVQDRDGRCW